MINEAMCYLVNSLCKFMYSKELKEFLSNKNVREVQEEKLMEIIANNSECDYGRYYEFADIRSVKDFQEKVPLTDYEDYVPYIEKIMKGEERVLTEEKILLLELSSGSTSASKLIPYTESLKNEFQKGIRPWLCDLYSEWPELKGGKSYWSVTPAATKNKYTEGGIPIGFEDDKEYFGVIEKKLLGFVLAVPSETAKVENIEEFYYKTSLDLLRCSGLRLISVWNPSFLMLLLEYMQKNAKRLEAEISIHDRKRGKEIREILENGEYNKLWIKLKIISCWCDANAASYAEKLRELFPDVKVQPKGLLATEGFVSFPLSGADGSVLSVKSHFFEFQSEENGEIFTAESLEQGKKYSVILTTSGGFYRYRLKDVIEVKGFYDKIPVIKFLGKQDKVSDLFGEKLNEVFVRHVLKGFGIKEGFFMLAPETDRYVLYIEGKAVFNITANSIDNALRENFHYDYCRKLGQLKGLKIFSLTGNPEKEYLEECVKRGQRLGDIKPAVLIAKGDWDKVFKGEYL